MGGTNGGREGGREEWREPEMYIDDGGKVKELQESVVGKRNKEKM